MGLPAGFPSGREPWRRAARRSSRDVRERIAPMLILPGASLHQRVGSLGSADSGAPGYSLCAVLARCGKCNSNFK